MKNVKIALTILIFSFAIVKSFSQIDSNSSNEKSVDSLSQIVSILENKDLSHFKFKGVPIDGSLSEFVKKLKKRDFTVIKTTKETAILTGKFAGDEVHVLVQSSSKIVYGVTVVYNEHTSWNSINTQYQNLKSLLIKKYGSPQDTIEKFESSDYKDLGLELLALSEDRCTYMTHFSSETGSGMIRLSMSSDASIVLNYVDAINYLKVSNEAYDDL